MYLIEILHQTTTDDEVDQIWAELYLIEILHQTTTAGAANRMHTALYLIEILHQTTTNENVLYICRKLYLIEILHQTTTKSAAINRINGCILSKFYIKPQRCPSYESGGQSCILSKFYIKPQPSRSRRRSTPVVSYRNSTSNHNFRRWLGIYSKLYLIEILHQTTTLGNVRYALRGCILSKFYIKPQHCPSYESGGQSCILSKFYIKPQRSSMLDLTDKGCILSKFYIKPQPPWRA